MAAVCVDVYVCGGIDGVPDRGEVAVFLLLESSELLWAACDAWHGV